MSKMIKKAIISLLAVCMMFTCLTALCLFNVKADATLNAIQNSDYGLLDGASVRIPDGEDEYGFGLRYTVAISADKYAELQNLDVRYGLLITTYDNYKTKLPYDKNTFAINDSDYDFNVKDTTKMKAVKLAVSELSLYPEDGEDVALRGKYYLHVSMTNIGDSKDTQFIAISYVSYKGDEGITNFVFTDPDLKDNVRSMTYVAQKALETPADLAKIGDKIDDFKATYIEGVKTNVDVKFNYSYDGAFSFNETESVILNVDKYTVDGMKSEVEKLIDASSFENLTISSDTTIYANGFDANGFTGENTVINVNLNVKNADDYSDIYGYFANDDTANLSFGADNVATVYDEEGNVEATYKLYKNNAVIVKVAGKTYLGELKDGKLSITIDNVDYTYGAELELSSNAYSAIAGSYVLDGKTLVLSSNGDAKYDSEDAKYVLIYDEVSEKFVILIATETPIIKQVNKVGNAYSIVGAHKPASKAQYEAVAGTYSCDSGYLAGEYVTFNANGKITKAVNSVTTEIGSFMLANDGASLSGTINDVALTGTFGKVDNVKSITLTGDSEYTFTCTVVTGNTPYDVIGSESGVIYSSGVYGFVAYNSTVVGKTFTDPATCPTPTPYPEQYNDWYYLVGVYNYANQQIASGGSHPYAYKLSKITDDFFSLTIRRFSNNGAFTTYDYMMDSTLYCGVIDGVRWVNLSGLTNTGAVAGNETNFQKFVIETPTMADRRNDDEFNAVYNSIQNVAKAKIADYKAGVNNGYVESGDGEQSVDIYQEIAGTYLPGKSYDGTVEVWKWGKYNLSAEIYPEGHEYAGKHKITNFVVSGEGWYELEPITENFGIIRAQTAYTGAWYNGVRGYREGWYAKVNGEYVLRISACNGDGKYYHPNDYVKEGSTFSSWKLFDELAGNANELGATSKTYTDVSGATLKLENPGDMKDNGAGFELLLNGSETPVLGSYDFIALSDTFGKFLVHFGKKVDGAHNGYDKDDNGNLMAENYTMGEYKKFGDNWLISFSYKGVTYNFAINGYESVATALSGKYFGADGSSLNLSDITDINVLSVNEGSFIANGAEYKYVVSDNKTIITSRNNDGKDVLFIK